MEFDWDEANIEHIAAHDVEPEEAEAAFFGFRVPLKVRIVDGEQRQAFLGSVGERILLVAYTIRSNRVRVITAYNANPTHCRQYQKKRGR
ncbi:MAG: BrnT family toxin [Cyanobacteria bacterium NC_groundwater_1444_Ag_S-0.65um_54_12]|nr:BrnT family toxin [Cyanobacteria bacterium NC_groundwater_1444_Ag_S-0.65um_54_12]